MKTSTTTIAIFAALAKAQGQIENASKDSENPFFKSRYADLASVWNVIRGPLSANGLALIQSVETEFLAPAIVEGDTFLPVIVTINSLLSHESGEFVESTLKLRTMESTPQAIGSTITYGRRYETMALCGVAPEEDDGNTASVRPTAPQASRPAPQSASLSPAAVKGPKLSPKDGVEALISRTTNKALRDKLNEILNDLPADWRKDKKDWTDTEWVTAGQRLRAFLATPEAAKLGGDK